MHSQIRLKTDMGAVCLVNRIWKNAMAPDMWAYLMTDFRPTEFKVLKALLNSASGILPHIRRLNVLDAAREPKGNARIRELISIIPSGRLIDFDSDESVSVSTIELLLRNHPYLKSLRTPLDSRNKVASNQLVLRNHS